MLKSKFLMSNSSDILLSNPVVRINKKTEQKLPKLSKSAKQSCQAVVLLSVVGGVLIKILEYKMFSVVAMKEHTSETYKKTIKSMEDWPKTGDTDDNLTWIWAKLDLWGDNLHGIKDFHNLAIFSTVCSRCLSDLELQFEGNRYKMSLILDLKEDIERIHDFIDPTGSNFPAYEKADALIGRLHKIIDWKWRE